MPRFTEAQLDTLREAVASGVLTVTYDGPPRRSVTYQSLDAMRSLLADMEREVNNADAPRSRLATFSKGF